MFDFAWSEIALIGVVALIAIGPKDMPVALKTVAQFIKKARRMAGEFQTHVDEMMRDADLAEVRNQINEIRNFDFKSEVERAVDADGSIRETFASNPFEPAAPVPASDVPTTDTAVLPELEVARAPVEAVAQETLTEKAPAFIPPEIANRPAPPAFIPPDAIRS